MKAHQLHCRWPWASPPSRPTAPQALGGPLLNNQITNLPTDCDAAFNKATFHIGLGGAAP